MQANKLNFHTFLASFGGVGFLPFAPGTWGTLAALGLYFLIPEAWLFGPSLVFSLPLLILFFLLAVYLSSQAETTLGHDSGHIVIDEVCGYFVSVLFLPKMWQIALYGFIFFRGFDIAKPFPINRAQNLPRGWGVVADDLIAGVFANLLLHIVIKIYPKFFGL